MKGIPPVLAAGGSFAIMAIAGTGLGILLAGRTGSQMWVLGGLFAGMALGGYAAVRLIARSI